MEVILRLIPSLAIYNSKLMVKPCFAFRGLWCCPWSKRYHVKVPQLLTKLSKLQQSSVWFSIHFQTITFLQRWVVFSFQEDLKPEVSSMNCWPSQVKTDFMQTQLSPIISVSMTRHDSACHDQAWLSNPSFWSFFLWLAILNCIFSWSHWKFRKALLSSKCVSPVPVKWPTSTFNRKYRKSLLCFYLYYLLHRLYTPSDLPSM